MGGGGGGGRIRGERKWEQVDQSVFHLVCISSFLLLNCFRSMCVKERNNSSLPTLTKGDM